MAHAAQIVDMSAVALHKWMRKLGPYLAALLVNKTQVRTTFAPERWAGYDIIVVDATVVNRPGSEGTTARVHHALRDDRDQRVWKRLPFLKLRLLLMLWFK